MNRVSPVPFSHEAIESNIPARFSAVVSVFGEHTAVIAGETRLSYGDLDRVARRLAWTILDAVGPSDTPVALLCKHNAGLVVGILGILKAGKTYVALMPSHPQPHLAALLDHVQARLIVCDSAHLALAASLAQTHFCQVLCLDSDPAPEPASSLYPEHDPELVIPPERTAVIAFTSGSSGEPKGVMRSHRSLLHRLWLTIHYLHIEPKDRVSFLLAASFGSSQSDLFGALLTGATLCMYDLRTQGVGALADWINAVQVTWLHVPSELFRHWIQLQPPHMTFPSLRLVAPAGRIFHRDLVAARLHLPVGCKFVSRLASGETMLVAQMLIDAHGPLPESTLNLPDSLPVGLVMPDTEIAILDESGQPVAPGEVGEIVVASSYLSPGYWRRPDLTARVFSDDPTRPGWRRYRMGDLVRMRPDGLLEFHGRRDERVKVRGFTVELGAVEAVLLAQAGVRAGTVVTAQGTEGEMRLIAYYVPDTHPGPTANEVWRSMARMLPEYMLPAAFVVLDALPLTPNGKVDRRALPAAISMRPLLDTPFVPPGTESEMTLARIWASVLGFDEIAGDPGIGIHDSFLDLGGNSILAARITARVLKTFGAELAASALLQAGTIAQMAAYLDEQTAGRMNPSLVESWLADLETLTEQEALERLDAQGYSGGQIDDEPDAATPSPRSELNEA